MKSFFIAALLAAAVPAIITQNAAQVSLQQTREEKALDTSQKLKEALAPLASEEQWLKSIEVFEKASSFATGDASGMEEEDITLWNEVNDVACTDPQSVCNLKPTKSAEETFENCTQYDAPCASLKLDSLVGRTWYEIEGYGSQATLTLYVQFEVDDKVKLVEHDNATFEIFFYMQRWFAGVDLETTTKKTGVTVHRMVVNSRGVITDTVGTNVDAISYSMVPAEYGWLDGDDVDTQSLPHGYTKDFSTGVTCYGEDCLGWRSSTSEGFDLNQSITFGDEEGSLTNFDAEQQKYKLCISHTITDPAEILSKVTGGHYFRARPFYVRQGFAPERTNGWTAATFNMLGV